MLIFSQHRYIQLSVLFKLFYDNCAGHVAINKTLMWFLQLLKSKRNWMVVRSVIRGVRMHFINSLAYSYQPKSPHSLKVCTLLNNKIIRLHYRFETYVFYTL